MTHGAAKTNACAASSFFCANGLILEVGDLNKQFNTLHLSETEKIVGIESHKHPSYPGAHVEFAFKIGKKE